MPTPKQHARATLKSLRALITNLQAAEADGITLEFLDQGEAADAQATFLLSTVPVLLALVPADIGARARVVSVVEVFASEPDEAV